MSADYARRNKTNFARSRQTEKSTPAELLISTILVALALILYTIGVWAERLAGRRKPWHLIFFWGGLIFDTTGTGMMMDMTAA